MSGEMIGVVKKTTGKVSSLEWANEITLDSISVVKMPFGPMDVQSYKIDGANLIVTLSSGDVITVKSFFSKLGREDEHSELILEDNEGIQWQGQFDPAISEFAFTEMTVLDTSADVAAGALANVPGWAIMGLAALAVGGTAAAVHNSGSSSSSRSSGVGSDDAKSAQAEGVDDSEDDDGKTDQTAPETTVTAVDAEKSVDPDAAPALSEPEDDVLDDDIKDSDLAAFEADEGVDLSGLDALEVAETDVFNDKALELTLGDVIAEVDTDAELQFDFGDAEEDLAELQWASADVQVEIAAVDVQPVVDPLDDLLEQSHPII